MAPQHRSHSIVRNASLLVALIQPFAHSGRAAALDSILLQARGGVWHKKHREAGEVPPPSIAKAILVYQLAVLYRHEHGLDLNVGLTSFLQAA